MADADEDDDECCSHLLTKLSGPPLAVFGICAALPSLHFYSPGGGGAWPVRLVGGPPGSLAVPSSSGWSRS